MFVTRYSFNQIDQAISGEKGDHAWLPNTRCYPTTIQIWTLKLANPITALLTPQDPLMHDLMKIFRSFCTCKTNVKVCRCLHSISEETISMTARTTQARWSLSREALQQCGIPACSHVSPHAVLYLTIALLCCRQGYTARTQMRSDVLEHRGGPLLVGACRH